MAGYPADMIRRNQPSRGEPDHAFAGCRAPIPCSGRRAQAASRRGSHPDHVTDPMPRTSGTGGVNCRKPAIRQSPRPALRVTHGSPPSRSRRSARAIHRTATDRPLPLALPACGGGGHPPWGTGASNMSDTLNRHKYLGGCELFANPVTPRSGQAQYWLVLVSGCPCRATVTVSASVPVMFIGVRCLGVLLGRQYVSACQ